MTLCPAGHASAATDYCDVCGAPMGSAVAAPPAPVAEPAADQICLHCDMPNAPDVLFCENCGYDFTTGAKPRAAGPSLLDLDTPLPPPAVPAMAAPEPVAVPEPPSREPEPTLHAAEPELPAVEPVPKAAPAPTPQPVNHPVEQAPAVHDDAPARPALSDAVSTRTAEPMQDWRYVAELWVDPDWFRDQDAPDPLPSPGLPVVVPLRRSRALIGRPSRSRGIDPELDCGTDSSVSRRHAELSTDGFRWWIEDLGSANGTYVSAAGAALPTQPIHGRTELAPGDRIYVGAWTRIVLRAATPDELDAFR